MEQPKLQTAADMFLKLDRPIVFFDLETTGKDIYHDRIIEICAIKIFPDGKEETLHHLINVGSSRVDLQACKLEYSIVSPK